jgi:hypothetical protein
MGIDIIEQYNTISMEGQTKKSDSSAKKRILMLLAAGFSVDETYPTGADINKAISSLEDNMFSFDFYGGIVGKNNQCTVVSNYNGNIDDINNKAYRFMVEAIKHYVAKVGQDYFNYEDFYDIIDTERVVERKDDIFSIEYREIGKSFIEEIDYEEAEYYNLIHRIPAIYNQIIAYYLKERKSGLSFYDDVSCSIEEYPKYSNFIQFLIDASNSNLIDVFTLNHDLLFESFNRVNGLEGKISDGFDDYGSNYFAFIRHDGCNYRCRLARYTGNYEKPIRLYKLHGSIDYVPFYKTIKTQTIPYTVPQNYIKLKKGISPFNVYKNKGCSRKYEESLNPYNHPDFLSGTKVKITKYDNNYLYKKLHRRFRNVLRNADVLIIIGYGGNDKAIEDQILANYDYNNKKTYIIDYAPKEKVYNLRDKLDAILLKGKVNDQINNILL